HVVGGMVRRSRIRTAAAVEMANQPRTVQQVAPAPAPAPAPAAKPTAQQRLDQLDKLAAGGYITPEEYKAKKKAILDSM
ncbi:MAG: SHOCT domain-containing protein, partial [Desulfobacterales bacterium]